MSNYTVDPNTGILIPTPGEDPGPDYADHISDALTTLSAIRHTGAANHDGLQIPTAGLDIDEDLSAQSHNLTNLRSTRYADQPSLLVGVGDLNCLYFKDGDFWLNNGAGAPIQVTTGNQLNVVTGSLSYDTVDINSNLTISALDTTVLVAADSSSIPIIVTLPPAGDVSPGRFYLIKDANGTSQAHNITVNGDGTDTIDGSLGWVIADNYLTIGVVSDGVSNWYLFQYDRKIYRAGETIQLTQGASLVGDGYAAISTGGTLTVQGLTTLADMEVNDSALFASTVQVDGLLTVDDNANVTGTLTAEDINVNDDVSVTGLTTTFNLEVGHNALVGGLLTAGSDLVVTGDTSLGGGLDVAGSADITNSLIVGGGATVSGSVVSGSVVTGSLTASSNAIIGTSLTVGTTTALGGAWYSNFLVTSYASVKTLDFSTRNNLKITLTGNIQFGFTGVQDGGIYILKVKQDSGGSHSINWNGISSFAFGGNSDTPASSANATTVWMFVYDNDTTTMRCLGTTAS
jgi:hypothetical protein